MKNSDEKRTFDLSDPLILEAAREVDRMLPGTDPIAPVQVTVSMKRVLPQGWRFDENTQTFHDAISGTRVTYEAYIYDPTLFNVVRL